MEYLPVKTVKLYRIVYFFVKRLHKRGGNFSQIESAFANGAQFEQSDAQAVIVGLRIAGEEVFLTQRLHKPEDSGFGKADLLGNLGNTEPGSVTKQI